MKVIHRKFPLEIEGKINRLMGEREGSKQIESIVFATLAETGAVDEVTATEHIEVFAPWEQNVDYLDGNLRVYPAAGDERKLYKCIQAHRSQADWTPDVTRALWSVAGDPAEEWPEWSQPIGAADAYMSGDKVSHNGKHWMSDADNNVWEPGVWGWTEQI